jgi:uncharacterized protein involved in tolerance to divalent cations
MSPQFVELFLTCGSWQEAERIAEALLQQKLVACVEFIEIRSKYWWQGNLEEGTEVKLIMHSVGELFDHVEATVKPLHSYETFVLQALSLAYISEQAGKWWAEITSGSAAQSLENNVK